MSELKRLEELQKKISDLFKEAILEVGRLPEKTQQEPEKAKPEPPKQQVTVETVKAQLPQALAPLLDVTEQHSQDQTWIEVKPFMFLGAERFSMLADAVKKMDGDYISQGKGSHFRIYSKEAK